MSRSSKIGSEQRYKKDSTRAYTQCEEEREEDADER